MKAIYLEKHKSFDELPYIDATDVFKYVSENTTQGQLLYQFASIIENWQNYWNENTPTAFGNPDYNYLSGQFVGYTIAKGFTKEETNTQIILKMGNRKVWIIDKIEKPKSYYESEKDNMETLNAILR